MARRVQRTTCSRRSQELLGRVKELKKDDDGVYSGDLTAEGIKEIFSFRGGGLDKVRAAPRRGLMAGQGVAPVALVVDGSTLKW